MSTEVLERVEGRFVVGEVQMTIICWARGTTKQNARRKAERAIKRMVKSQTNSNRSTIEILP